MESVFQPGAPAGYAVDALDKGQSMMQRATAARQLQQMREQQIAEEVVMAPLRREAAKTQLDTAKFQYQSALDMQRYERQIASLVPQAEKDFNTLMLIDNPDERAKAALTFSGKYAQLKNTKKWGQQFDAYDKIAQTLYTENSALAKLQAQGGVREELQRQKYEYEAALRKNAEDTKLEIANLKESMKKGSTQTKFEEELGTKAAQYFSAQQEKTAEHVRTLDTIRSARSEISKGTPQGVGEGLKTSAMQVMNTVTRTAGIPDVFDTSSREVLSRNYSDMALAAAARMKNQGQITESERKLLANTVASFGNSPKAAEYIMDFMEAVAQREIEKAKYLNKVKSETGFVDQAAEVPFYEENPLSFYIPANGPEDKTEQNHIDSLLEKYGAKKTEGK